MQNESQGAIAFVKSGIVDKLAPKPVCQKVVMAGTRTFRIPYQAPHPYLDWAKRHLVNLYFDKFYKAFPEAKMFHHCTLYGSKVMHHSRTYQMESK